MTKKITLQVLVKTYGLSETLANNIAASYNTDFSLDVVEVLDKPDKITKSEVKQLKHSYDHCCKVRLMYRENNKYRAEHEPGFRQKSAKKTMEWRANHREASREYSRQYFKEHYEDPEWHKKHNELSAEWYNLHHVNV